jgi:hypothetical protein
MAKLKMHPSVKKISDKIKPEIINNDQRRQLPTMQEER